MLLLVTGQVEDKGKHENIRNNLKVYPARSKMMLPNPFGMYARGDPNDRLVAKKMQELRTKSNNSTINIQSNTRSRKRQAKGTYS